MKNKLKISIVIRTHNHKKLLERLLKKIKEQKQISKPEIVIIDSCSTEGTKELAIKEGCKIVNIDPKKFSHAYTFNLGAEKAKGEIIIYASVDIIPKNDLWLYYLIKHFNNKKVAGVFSKQEPIKNFNAIEEFKLKKMFPDTEKSPAFFSNASGAVRKSVWKKIRYEKNIPFQYMGGEDQRLMVEAKKKGYEVIYEPKSIVYHSHKYSIKSRVKNAYAGALNKEKVKKWEKNMFILDYSKKDLAKYLIKKRRFKTLLWDLLFVGILLRISDLLGKLNTNH